MIQNRCPICGQEYKYDNRHSGREKPCIGGHCDEYGFLSYYCGHFDFECSIEESIISSSDSVWRDKLLNLATEQMLHARCGTADDEGEKWHFYYDDTGKKHFSQSPKYINLANHLTNYPAQTIDVAHRVLMNLCSKYPHYGDIICPVWTDRRLFFQCENNNAGNCGIMRVLEDFGYVKDPSNNECYSITASGWQKIDKLQKQEQILQQGFIAMAFRDETRSIREAFRKGITESGYSVGIIDEKEHNNQIVPEIFFEIERSKFVVVDVTYPNYGAYYEAGYAQALGKQVIICCRKSEFHDKNSRPHFDISQKSMIVWKDEQDLVDRLKRRIEATVK